MNTSRRILHIVAAMGMWFTMSADPSTNFGIYLTTTPMDVTSMMSPRIDDLSRIALEDTPMIAESDVESYDGTNGIITVKEETLKRIPSPAMTGRTFVVVAGGERIFLGALWSPWSSFGVSVPTWIVGIPAGPGHPSNSRRLYPGARSSSATWTDPRIARALSNSASEGTKRATAPNGPVEATQPRSEVSHDQ
jgi:hypothetical protein